MKGLKTAFIVIASLSIGFLAAKASEPTKAKEDSVEKVDAEVPDTETFVSNDDAVLPEPNRQNTLFRNALRPLDSVNFTIWSDIQEQKAGIIIDKNTGRVYFPNGTYPLKDIDENSITNDKIADTTIQNTKLVDKTITAAKIADKTIGNDKIADKTIGAEKLSGFEMIKVTAGPHGPILGATWVQASAQCPTNTRVISGGCEVEREASLNDNLANFEQNQWYCSAIRRGEIYNRVTAHAYCLKGVPIQITPAQ